MSEGEWVSYMASDLTVECVDHLDFFGSLHGNIKAVGLAGLLTVLPLSFGAFYFNLYKIRRILEARTGRKCTPLMDFAISRW